jgi:hypothetical protein
VSEREMPDGGGYVIACGTAPRENPSPRDYEPRWCPKCKANLCPKCGAHCSEGYGLAYGGIGAYSACNECDWFSKTQDADPKAPPVDAEARSRADEEPK